MQSRLAGRQFISANPGVRRDRGPGARRPRRGEEPDAGRYGLADWADDDFTVRDQAAIAQTAQGTTEVMSALLGAVAAWRCWSAASASRTSSCWSA
ncbi:MAG: hypothetical protein R3F59_00600 [Myxococcota bacterium]